MSMLKLSLERKMIPLVLSQPKTGKEMSYCLLEMDGTSRDKYLTQLGGMMRIDAATGKPNGLKKFDGMHASLIALCLFECDHEEIDGVVVCTNIAEQPVDKKSVASWPSSVQQILFEKAQDLSGLGEKGEDESKNDSEESDTDGTD